MISEAKKDRTQTKVIIVYITTTVAILGFTVKWCLAYFIMPDTGYDTIYNSILLG